MCLVVERERDSDLSQFTMYTLDYVMKVLEDYVGFFERDRILHYLGRPKSILSVFDI